MASKKVIIGAVVIIAIVAVAAIAIGGSASEKDAGYNFELRFADMYPDEYVNDTYYSPDDGKKFLILDGMIENRSVSDGFYSNELNVIWTVTLPDGTILRYSNGISTYPAPKLTLIYEGEHAPMAFCWQVDEDLQLDGITVDCKYDGGKSIGFEYDPTLGIEKSAGTVEGPNARANYGISFVNSYTTSYGSVQRPDSGNQFMILKIEIYNDRCPTPISTNPFIFEWSAIIDGIAHTYLDDESLYPTPASIEIEKGGHAMMIYCWEVSKDITADDVTVSYEYSAYRGLHLILDTTIDV